MKNAQLKNVKTFLGMEGHGFNASFYLDGKKLALIIDSAQGGCLDYHFEGKTFEQRETNEKLFNAYIDSLPPEAMPTDCEEWEKSLYTNGFRKLDADTVICKMIDDIESDKWLARQKKTKVLFSLPNEPKGNYRTVKHNGNVQRAVDYVMNKYPNAIIA